VHNSLKAEFYDGMADASIKIMVDYQPKENNRMVN